MQKSKNGRNEKKFLAEVVLLVPINHLSKFLPSFKKHPVLKRSIAYSHTENKSQYIGQTSWYILQTFFVKVGQATVCNNFLFI